MSVITAMLEFISHLTDAQTTMLFLGFIIGIGIFVRIITGSVLVSMMVAEMPNIWNLTIYLTEPLLKLGTKPFMPLWISLILLALPFIYMILTKLFSPIDRFEVKK